MQNDLIKELEIDIERCKKGMQEVKNSEALYLEMVNKYSVKYNNFKSSIMTRCRTVPAKEKEHDYCEEVKNVGEKLKMLVIIEKENDPYYQFKYELESDIKKIQENLTSNDEKLYQLEKEIMAKYSNVIQNLDEGLLGYNKSQKLLMRIVTRSLQDNLKTLCFKLIGFKNAGYPTLKNNAHSNVPNSSIVVNNQQITNSSNSLTNTIDINVNFQNARDKIDEMSTLSASERKEIIDKIDEIENVIKSELSKNKKWDKLNGIIKWIADKGVDVATSLLPLLLQL